MLIVEYDDIFLKRKLHLRLNLVTHVTYIANNDMSIVLHVKRKKSVFNVHIEDFVRADLDI